MPSPYSIDLRERVVATAMADAMSRAELAAQFQISEPTLYSWLRQYRQTGSVAPKPHGGGRRRSVDAQGEPILGALVAAENDRTLDEYCAQLAERTGARPSRSALHRALGRLKLPRKKVRPGE